jgi:DNA-binding NarL/FixJ family response regulator
MDPAVTFLVVDYHPESRYLLVKTLLRKFPGATILECDEAEQALKVSREVPLSAIITHRTVEETGADLVRQFRADHPRMPIIMVSGIDRQEAALAAGATCFLHYDEWLRIGSVVETHLMGTSNSGATQPARE